MGIPKCGKLGDFFCLHLFPEQEPAHTLARCQNGSSATTAKTTYTTSPVVVIIVSPGSPAQHERGRFLKIFEETRNRYRFVVLGYVVMPEHIHLLLSEPERAATFTADSSCRHA